MTAPALRSAYNTLLQRGRLSPNPHQAALVTRLATLQDELASTSKKKYLPGQQENAPKGLYIYGSVGTGKSRIADLFASTLPSTITKRRIHFHAWMMDIHSRLHIARASPIHRGDPLIDIGREVRHEARVLCFDEFQVTDIADAMILRRLFGSFWQEGGVMISTSNRHPDDLYENGLNRDVVVPFFRDLQQRCDVWEIGGEEDYRMMAAEGGERAETVFTDQLAFEQSLDGALGGNELAEVSIPVHGGRRLEVAAAANAAAQDTGTKFSVVSGTFQQLCEASLGTSDYHALCPSTETIYISGLRKFARHELDFVRRFITMIDIAYETKTRVVCLSSVVLVEAFREIIETATQQSRRSTPQNKNVNRAGSIQKGAVRDMRVQRGGGASSSMMSTFVAETEWSATGLMTASLASGGAGETDVGFAIGRAISRLHEMGSPAYGVRD